MIVSKITEAQIEEYKQIYLANKDKLQVNQKSGTEIYQYLKNKYILIPCEKSEYKEIIRLNILENECYREKLKGNKQPDVVVYYIKNEAAGKHLYAVENRDDITIWGKVDIPILVGVDLESGYYYVEGSCKLWDELCAFRGLDEYDLENYIVVGEYLKCLQKFVQRNLDDRGN